MPWRRRRVDAKERRLNAERLPAPDLLRAGPEPSHALAETPADVERTLTEIEARRLGRVRRFFARRPVASDLLVCALAAIPSVSFIVPEEAGGLADSAHRWAGLLVTALTVAVLAVRRRFPLVTLALVTVATVAGLAGGWGAGIGGVACGFAMYTVAAARPSRTAWSALALSLALVTASGVMWPSTPGSNDGTVRFSVGPVGVAGSNTSQTGAATAGAMDVAVLGQLTLADLMGLTWLAFAGVSGLAVGSGVRSRREHVTSLVQRSAALVLAAEERAHRVSTQERALIAREMHDVVAHSLSVMIALADGAQASMDRQPDDAHAALERLTDRGRAALGDMRRVVGLLREEPEVTSPQPAGADLEELVARFRDAGMPIRLTRSGMAIPDVIGLAIYRIVQESLTNVLRHVVGVGCVEVEVHVGAGSAQVTVIDDGGIGVTDAPRPGTDSERTGVGLETGLSSNRASGRTRGRPSVPGHSERKTPTPPGRGLIGMSERAAMHGGTLQAGPYGDGWRVHAVLRLGGDP